MTGQNYTYCIGSLSGHSTSVVDTVMLPLYSVQHGKCVHCHGKFSSFNVFPLGAANFTFYFCVIAVNIKLIPL